ncbi:MAG: hypothetical protein ACK5WZ_04110 [Pseudobdellovibrionaceae bacterium]
MYSGQNLSKQWVPNYAVSEKFEVCKSDETNTTTTPALRFYTRLNSDGTWKISFNYFNGLKVIGATEINTPPPSEYSWPIAHHDFPNGNPFGAGATLNSNLMFEVDEGWKATSWHLDYDTDSNYVVLHTSEGTNQIFFSCQAFNF